LIRNRDYGYDEAVQRANEDYASYIRRNEKRVQNMMVALGFRPRTINKRVYAMTAEHVNFTKAGIWGLFVGATVVAWSVVAAVIYTAVSLANAAQIAFSTHQAHDYGLNLGASLALWIVVVPVSVALAILVSFRAGRYTWAVIQWFIDELRGKHDHPWTPAKDS
jgi:hypothetical protein